MEVKSKVTENIRDGTKDLELIAKGESLVQERVRQEVEKVKMTLAVARRSSLRSFAFCLPMR